MNVLFWDTSLHMGPDKLFDKEPGDCGKTVAARFRQVPGDPLSGLRPEVSLEPRLASPPSQKHVRKELDAALRTRPHIAINQLLEKISFRKRFPELLQTLDACLSTGSRSEYHNIREHCLTTGWLEDILCAELQSAGWISPLEARRQTVCATLHDAGKPLYISRRAAAGSRAALRAVVEKASADEDQRIFDKIPGIAPEITALIAETSRFTGGIDCYLDFVEVLDDRGTLRVKGDLNKRMIRVADDMVLTSHPDTNGRYTTILVTPGERMLFHALNPDYHDSLYRKGLGWLRGTLELVPLDFKKPLPRGVIRLGTYAQIHSFIACRTLDTVMGLMASDSPVPADQFYLQRLNGHITG